MKRIPFSQVLKNASIDIRREYDRLYGMFCLQKLADGTGNSVTLRDSCAANFIILPFRGTCVSLDDFDDFYGYSFEKIPAHFNLEYLISFCEYSYNLAIYNQGIGYGMPLFGLSQPMQFYVQQVMKVIDTVGYMANSQDGITDFVPKDQAAISVAEIVDPTLSYRIIEYNHYSMKGDLERKKAVLVALADKLEPKRAKLKQINNRRSPGCPGSFRYFISFKLIHPSFAGKEGKSLMCSSHKEVFYVILFYGLHSLDTFASTLLGFEVVRSLSLDITQIGP